VNVSDIAAPGWDAISNAMAALYPDQEPRHMAYTPGLAFGGGLEGCSAYRAADHWHYVTYGLTELWAKEAGSDPARSGWGYELTMRVVGDAGEPPAWPYQLLEQTARYTHSTGRPFKEGDRLDPGGPITGVDGSSLVGVAFLRDPQLPDRDSDNGRLAFLQMVGITRAELDEMKATTTAAVIARLKSSNPLLITEPDP
jgi:suppressor of fused-like protein